MQIPLNWPYHSEEATAHLHRHGPDPKAKAKPKPKAKPRAHVARVAPRLQRQQARHSSLLSDVLFLFPILKCLYLALQRELMIRSFESL